MPSAKSTRFSGGGVVAEIFRGLRMPMSFSGGGGSSRNFTVVSECRCDSVGGGSSRKFQKGGPGSPKGR